MAHLNLSLKLKDLPAFAGRLLSLFLFISASNAEVLQFFDPTQVRAPSKIESEVKIFLANDPLSLREILSDWHGNYTPKSGQNIALLDGRIDLGRGFAEHYYLGYFYQVALFVEADKSFTDIVYTVKNKNDLEAGKTYVLDLDTEGIMQSGVLFSGNKKFYEDEAHAISFGGAVYLAYGMDMQEGTIWGDASAVSTKDYELEADSSYYYTHNYLYDLNVKNAYGFGYGSHVGVNYESKKHDIKIRFLVNDFLSKMYWQDLPFSEVAIQTKNKSYDENGYVKYTPTFSGLEQYRDYTQTIDPRYKLEVNVKINDTTFSGGVDRVYEENFPYLKMLHTVDDFHSVEVMHESRFGSFGVGYGYKYFKVAIIADEFTDFSSFGFSSSFSYLF